mgnify:CR=1 FL=1
MKQIKLNEETAKKFKEALDVFMVNPKNGNAMLDKIYDEQQQQTNKKGERQRDRRRTD